MPYRLSITSIIDMSGDAMDRTRSTDPLRTLEILVGVIVAVMTLLTGLVLVGTVVGTGSDPRRERRGVCLHGR